MMIFKKSLMLCALLSVVALYSCSDKDEELLPEPERENPQAGGPNTSYAAGWSWIKMPSLSVYDIQFVDDKIGYYTGGDVFKTTDGGSNWIPTNAPQIYNRGYSYLYFLDALTGWAVQQNTGTIVKTIDGGKNWTQINVYDSNIGPASVFTQIKFIDANTGYLMSEFGLLKSTNGGVSWKKIYEGNFTGPGMFFIDDKTCWISERGGITRSSDGETFTKVKFTEASIFYSIQFFNKMEGLALERNGQIWQTVDGGISWSAKAKVNLGDSSHDFWFFDMNNGYVSGMDGIAKVTGTQATNVVNQKKSGAWEMFFFNKDSGFVGSSSALLFKYKAPK